MENIIGILKAFSDSTRLKIYIFVSQEEKCVCKITDFIELAPSTISKHLSVLKQAGLVTSRKDGKWIYYKKKCACEFSKEISDLIEKYLVQEKQ